MATVIRTCRVCGKEYEVCANARRIDGIFRWQEVACSPDCGEEYLAAVLKGRESARIADNSYPYEDDKDPIFEDEEEIAIEEKGIYEDEEFENELL